jgi:hypothetical protein
MYKIRVIRVPVLIIAAGKISPLPQAIHVFLDK